MKGAANLRRSNRQSRTHSGRCTVLFSGHGMRRPPGHVRKYDYGSFRTGTQRGSPTDGVSDHAREPTFLCVRRRIAPRHHFSAPLKPRPGFALTCFGWNQGAMGAVCMLACPMGNDPFSAKKAGGCSRSCSNSRKWRQRSQTN